METEPRGRPSPGEHDPYYARYIDRVRSADALHALTDQLPAMTGFVGAIDPSRADFRYAPGKWTMRQVVGHVLDTERIFATRALRVARGDETPQPGFDENAYAEGAAADRRPLAALNEELALLRRANLALFGSFDDAAWRRVGHANGAPISVRAIAWILAGHADHHLEVLRERYLSGAG